jgi:membrane-associated phospholipid phosphatase
MNRSRTTQRRIEESALPWQATVAAEERSGSATLPARLRIFQALRNEWLAIGAACGPFEWIGLGYLAVSSVLIAIFSDNLGHPIRLLATRACVVALIVLLCRGADILVGSESQFSAFTQKFWHFWRHWYPHLFFLFCFEELAHLVHLISPQWQDAKLIAFDHWLTGVHPSTWLEQFATPALNEFMQFTYITYFIYLVVLGGILYYRKDWRGYWSVMTYSAVAYAMGYLIAISFPIESPWFSMAGSWHGELRGGPFTALINLIEHYGRVRGAAFPSEHVAGSFAALWGAWRHRRWLFWVMLPLVLGMCLSTVYGRYHYVADIVGGMVTGTLGYLVGRWLMRKSEQLRGGWEGAELEKRACGQKSLCEN